MYLKTTQNEVLFYSLQIRKIYCQQNHSLFNKLGKRNQKFQNIDQEFNYRMDILNFSDKEISSIQNNVYLIHYFGKSKPWTLKGINFGISEYYQSEFRKISKNKYHIVHKWKIDSLNYIFEIIFSSKLFKLKFPFRFIVEALRSFFN